jgi:hypothetical protein
MAHRNGAPMAFVSASIGGCGIFSGLDNGLIVAFIKQTRFNVQLINSDRNIITTDRNIIAAVDNKKKSYKNEIEFEK